MYVHTDGFSFPLREGEVLYLSLQIHCTREKGVRVRYYVGGHKRTKYSFSPASASRTMRCRAPIHTHGGKLVYWHHMQREENVWPSACRILYS